MDEAPSAEAPPTHGGPAAATGAPTGTQPPPPPRAQWWRQEDSRSSPGTAAAYSPAHDPRVRAAQGNGHAVAALSLGIAGLVLFLLSGFGLVFILNLPCSVLAWIFGRAGMRRVDDGETTARRGMAQAGMLLGVVGTVIGGLAIVAWALGFVFSEELRDEFQREWDRRQRG
ncbi:MAG: DUF4190 domain-containing protein [Solirubrobacteraceae bacterium]